MRACLRVRELCCLPIFARACLRSCARGFVGARLARLRACRLACVSGCWFFARTLVHARTCGRADFRNLHTCKHTRSRAPAQHYTIARQMVSTRIRRSCLSHGEHTRALALGQLCAHACHMVSTPASRAPAQHCRHTLAK